jgi:hypothetical protein
MKRPDRGMGRNRDRQCLRCRRERRDSHSNDRESQLEFHETSLWMWCPPCEPRAPGVLAMGTRTCEYAWAGANSRSRLDTNAFEGAVLRETRQLAPR